VEIATKATYSPSALRKFYLIFFSGINKKALRSISSWENALKKKQHRTLARANHSHAVLPAQIKQQ